MPIYKYECRCRVCRNAPNGFMMQTLETFRNHQRRYPVLAAAGPSVVETLPEEDDSMDVDAPEELPETASRDLASQQDVEYAESDDESEEDSSSSTDIVDLEFEVQPELLDYQEHEEELPAVSDNSTEVRSGMFGNALFAFMAAFLVLFQLKFTTGRGATVLLKLFNMVLAAFGQQFQFPATPSTVRQWVGFDQYSSHVKRYVACPNCHSIYDGSNIQDSCISQLFQEICNTPLFQPTPSRLPKKEFIYNSLVNCLELLFSRPGFEQQINEWRQRTIPEDSLFDVYDGAMWKQVRDENGFPFVNHRRSLLLTLNVDWFQPFSNSNYSCGAIYLAVNNLPRVMRFKKENTILVGVMPGPKEAKTHEMNKYLEPLVDELLRLYRGIRIKTHEHPDRGMTVRAALLIVACDIPAARKVSGFLSHSSVRACFKCDHSFPISPVTRRVDLSGFDTNTWTPTSRDQNLGNAERWRRADSRRNQEDLEKATGVRWSQLHRLPYFDVVRCTVVDPMHNLFLGTAKRMLDTWIKEGKISPQQLRTMKTVAEGIMPPPTYEMISKKISNSFAFMKAADWKSWCLVYSPLTLHGILPRPDLTNWMHFVNACRLLSKPSIRIDEVGEAHEHLMEFCKGYERLHEPHSVTPNMHLHGHLMHTVLDFGPIYAFWLFSFERYNGLLGGIDTNRKGSFEMTFLRTFVEDTRSNDFVLGLSEQLGDNASYFLFLKNLIGTSSVSATSTRLTSLETFDTAEFIRTSEMTVHAKGCEPLPDNAIVSRTKPFKMALQHYTLLLQFYDRAYGERMYSSYTRPIQGRPSVGISIRKFSTLRLHGHLFRSCEAQSQQGSYIQALFETRQGDEIEAWTGQVLYYFEHQLHVQGTKVPHFFAVVRWLRPYHNQPFADSGMELWRRDHLPLDTDSILPVQRIYSPVAIGRHRTQSRQPVDLTVVIPLQKKSYA